MEIKLLERKKDGVRKEVIRQKMMAPVSGDVICRLVNLGDRGIIRTNNESVLFTKWVGRLKSP